MKFSTMKFFIEKNIKNSGRLGSLLINHNEREYTYETPMFFIHTLSGSVPHLTSEVFQMVYNKNEDQIPPIQISIDSAIIFHEDFVPSKMSISKFVGLPFCPAVLSLHNPLNEKPTGYNSKSGVSIWSRYGRSCINQEKFSTIVKDLKPQITQSLSDDDVNSSKISAKRIKKSTQRTLEFLEDTLKEKSILENSSIFATIETGWFNNEEEGKFALTKIIEQSSLVSGFCINGIDRNEEMKENVIKNIILEKLPENKPKWTPGLFSPKEIINLVQNGVDLFDSSYVTKVTEEGKAFIFPLDIDTKNSPPNENLVSRTDEDIGNNTKNDDESDETNDSIIDLKNKRYFADFSPISKECSCFVCKQHTRSYIHHLLATEELLGPVLIMSHNLYHFDKFFQYIRNNIKNNNLHNIKGVIKS